MRKLTVILRTNVVSAVTHGVSVDSSGLKFIYKLKGKGDWVYGHLAKLTLFEDGKQHENLKIDEVTQAMEKMSIREKENQSKFWISVLSYAKKNYSSIPSANQKEHILNMSKLPMVDNLPVGAITAARVALKNNPKVTWHDAMVLYVKTMNNPLSIKLGARTSIIKARILISEYNEIDKVLTYWTLNGVDTNER